MVSLHSTNMWYYFFCLRIISSDKVIPYCLNNKVKCVYHPLRLALLHNPPLIWIPITTDCISSHSQDFRENLIWKVHWFKILNKKSVFRLSNFLVFNILGLDTTFFGLGAIYRLSRLPLWEPNSIFGIWVQYQRHQDSYIFYVVIEVWPQYQGSKFTANA